MKTFVKLTLQSNPPKPIYIHAERIFSIESVNDGSCIIGDIADLDYTVKETPEEIIEAIDAATAFVGKKSETDQEPGQIPLFPIGEICATCGSEPMKCEHYERAHWG